MACRASNHYCSLSRGSLRNGRNPSVWKGESILHLAWRPFQSEHKCIATRYEYEDDDNLGECEE